MSDKHTPNVISIGRDTSPSPMPFMAFLVSSVVGAWLFVFLFAPRAEPSRYHPTGAARTTTTTVEHDGHRLILATTMFDVSVLHHPDCQCHAKAESD